IQLQPTNASQHSNLLYALNYTPKLTAAEVFVEHLAWARQHAEPLTAQCQPIVSDRQANRRLRIGYVSPHFRAHAVNHFAEPILTHHDPTAVEVFCYSDVLEALCDAATRRIQEHVAGFRSIVGRSDEQVCQTIRADRIDVLVDLTGHIG